jgi:hypothetical protein
MGHSQSATDEVRMVIAYELSGEGQISNQSGIFDPSMMRVPSHDCSYPHLGGLQARSQHLCVYVKTKSARIHVALEGRVCLPTKVGWARLLVSPSGGRALPAGPAIRS